MNEPVSKADELTVAVGSESSAVVRLTTPLGSKVVLHGIRAMIEFDWFEEEPACIDCEVDEDATRRSHFTELWWECPSCGRHHARLDREA